MRRRRTPLSRGSTGAPTVPMTLRRSRSSMRPAAQLEAFKRHYTPEHPDVKALERQIADLQVEADLEAKMPPQKKPLSPAEVARQKRLKELQTELEMIDREIASELAESASLKKALNDYQGKIASVPRARPISLALMRDYETLRRAARGSARKAAGVEDRRKSGASSDRRAVEDRGSRVPPREAEQSEGAARGPVWRRDWRTGPRRDAGRLPRVSRFELQDRRRCGARAGVSGAGAHPRDGGKAIAGRSPAAEPPLS